MTDLEVIEEYYQIGMKRYRVKVRDSNIIFNVSAESESEAIEKARRMLEKIRPKP